MRIIVCLKQIQHVFGKTGRDDATNFISQHDEISCINPLDIAALELALCVKDSRQDAKVILLSLGEVIAESDLRRCFAMGADELWQIESSDSLDGWAKSLQLADAASELKADLVFCGEKSMDSGSGQIGPFMAFHLGTPFISRVTDITVSETGQPIRVERNCGRGKREIVECSVPAVFSAVVGPKIPRYPSFKNKRQLSQEPIRKMSVKQQATSPKVIYTRVFSARPRPKQVVPPDSSLPAFERIEQLLRGSSVEKKGEMVKGTPEQQAERILSFLQEKEFIQSAEQDT
jgi:electron transfer flavoprotein beta subunit